MEPDQSLVPVRITSTLFEDLDEHFQGFHGRWLISCLSFDSDWPVHEMHPAGDEIVCLLSGSVRLLLEHDGIEDSVHLSEPGAYAIVPKGIWHRAMTKVPTVMLFVTPGQGTQHVAA